MRCRFLRRASGARVSMATDFHQVQIQTNNCDWKYTRAKRSSHCLRRQVSQAPTSSLNSELVGGQAATGRYCWVAAVSAFYPVLVHQLADLTPLSLRPCGVASHRVEPLARPWHSHSLPSRGRSPFRAWPLVVVSFIFMFWYSYKGLNPIYNVPMLGTHKAWMATPTSPFVLDAST